MTQKEAKELTLVKWRFRHKHPNKILPNEIVAKLVGLPGGYPLCELFGSADCYGCPLVIKDMRCGAGVYKNWCEAHESGNWDAASYYAGEIVKAVEKWSFGI